MPESPGLIPREPYTPTLTDEHALLLEGVTARAEDVLSVVAEDRWPRRRLQALVGYLRSEVVRQATDEERLLFPECPPTSGFARLKRDHVRLRYCVEALAKAAGDEPGWTAARLETTCRDLLAMLKRHLAVEEELLTTARTQPPPPATEAVTGRSHAWYPLTEGAVIDLDALPGDHAADAIVERLLRLRVGEQVELRSGGDLREVWLRMDRLDPGGYGFVYLREGPPRWAMQVIRRPAG